MSLTLSGYGATESDARSQALLVARESAELLDSGTIWTQLLSSAHSDGPLTLPWLAEVFVSSTANASLGWDFGPGECESVDSTETARVNVRWGAGTQVEAGSDSVAMAIEEARRRSCHGAWAESFSVVFGAVATADPSNREAMFQEGVSELNGAFGACMSSEDYVVQASRHPRLRDSGAEFCEVATAADAQTSFVGKARGSSRAQAMERASIQAIRATLRATHSSQAAALANAEPAMRAMLLAQALSHGIHAIGAQSIGGNAHARCAPVEGDLIAAWRPGGTCGDGFEGAAWSADVCEEVTNVGRGHVRDAVAATGADADPAQTSLMLLTGFGVVSGCAHDCGAQVQVTGVGAFAQTRGAHCRSEQDARAIAERGIEERNLSGLLHCAGPALFGNLMARYQEEPERFWDAVSAVREQLTITVEDGHYWVQLP